MRLENQREWYYLGCGDGTGHYVFTKYQRRAKLPILEKMDGQLCPKNRKPYQALLTRIPHLDYTALAWWDNSVDPRPGSNSIIFAPSPISTVAGIQLAMDRWFPWVVKRLPQPLIILPDENIYTP